MLRSFSYAAYSALNAFAQRRPDDARNLESWATTLAKRRLHRVPSRLSVHRSTQLTRRSSRIQGQSQLLLNAYLLEKSLYELLYELNNRPTWVHIPLAGIQNLLG